MNLGRIAWHSFALIVCSTGAVIAALDLADALTGNEDGNWSHAVQEDRERQVPSRETDVFAETGSPVLCDERISPQNSAGMV